MQEISPTHFDKNYMPLLPFCGPSSWEEPLGRQSVVQVVRSNTSGFPRAPSSQILKGSRYYADMVAEGRPLPRLKYSLGLCKVPLPKHHLLHDLERNLDDHAQIQKEVSGVAAGHVTAQNVASGCDQVSLFRKNHPCPSAARLRIEERKHTLSR